MRANAALIILLAASTAHADWTTGQDVWPAVFVDVTPEGFSELEVIARAVLPPTIPIEVPRQEGVLLSTGILDVDYYVELRNFFVVPEIVQADIVPLDAIVGATPRDSLPGRLDIDLVLAADVSDVNDRAQIELDVDSQIIFGLIDFIGFNTTCDIYTQLPITVNADTWVGLEVEKDRQGNVIFDSEGNIQLDATIGEITLDIDLSNNALSISGCLIGDILDFVEAIGLFRIEEFILGEIEPTVDDLIADTVGDLEPQIEDAFDALVIEESFDLLGNSLDVRIFPREFEITDQGLRLQMAGAFDPGDEPHPCVARYDTGLTLQTIPPVDPRYPLLTDRPLGAIHHMGIEVNDDWLNQALYAVWYQGLLCQQISGDSSPVDLPIPIDTNLLTLLAGGEFDEYFEETGKVVLATRPEEPPVMITGGESTADIEINNLGLDIYAELDGRLMRTVGLNLDAVASVDVDFDAPVGSVDLAVDFDPAAITSEVVFNDLKPTASARVATGFATLAQQLIGPLITGALPEDLGFDLPAIAGLGLATGDVIAVGPILDFIGVYGTVGTVTYGDPTAGCDLLGGGDGGDPLGGCSGDAGLGGCSSSAVPVRMGWLLLPLLVVWRRRR